MFNHCSPLLFIRGRAKPFLNFSLKLLINIFPDSQGRLQIF